MIFHFLELDWKIERNRKESARERERDEEREGDLYELHLSVYRT